MITLAEMTARAAGRGAKVEITVERLLQWAYAEQLVHMARPDDVPAEVAASYSTEMASVRDDGAVPITSSRNFGFEAAPDAYVVHDAVMGLGEQEIVLPPSCYGAAVVRGIIPEIETRFKLSLPSLMFQWAVRCKRPDWMEQSSLVMERGTALYGITERRRRVVVMYTVRSIGDKPWEVERARLIYCAWVDALERLRWTLRGELERFAVTVDNIKRAPWTTRD